MGRVTRPYYEDVPVQGEEAAQQLARVTYWHG